jgi:putative redox protein
VRGKGFSEKAVQQAIEISEQKNCSVAATIRGVAEITFGFQIVEDSSDERTHSRE